MITAELFLQLINASFMLILNIYMVKEGYPDHIIADFVSFRFLGVMLLAFPLGLYIKGRKLAPFFYLSGLLGPIMALLTLYAIQKHLDILIYGSLMVWGIALTCMQVVILPYIMRNTNKETQSEAISLNYATWSISTIISGVLIYLLNEMNPALFDERLLLQIIAILGFVSLFFIYKAKGEEKIPALEKKRYDLKNFDWILIIKSLFPVLIIAVGAGFTIPFINLFFYFIHDMDFEKFSILGSTAAVLVACLAIAVPQVKRKYGYKVAITVSQSIAIVALILLASTELYSQWYFAVYIAIGCFIIRQPLMNMAGPMTSELTMLYVGPRNQEVVSALIAAIWSGSWFISSQLFRIFRESGLSYANIFFITAGLYSVGVIWYYFLIVDYHKRKRLGLIEG
ncbi:MFS transporter [Candidatus Amoebophilus asiaticus]|nr:MFS transporter [Candidatus Amoebophilus asiaticus]